MTTRLVRVTCTLPAELVKAADAIAAREGRSRSWVLAEALRRHAVEGTGSRPAVRVSEPAEESVPVPVEGLDEAQLDSDLRLTPEQRVHAVEEMVRMAYRLRRPPRAHQVVAFDAFEDFWEWKRREDQW